MKFTLLYFLKGVLLSADPKRNVSAYHMSMVDDLDMFRSYPWGTNVFDTNLDSLLGKDLTEKYRECLRKPPHKQLPNVKETHTLYGFPFAF